MASSAAKLRQGRGDLWDSGRVEGALSTGVLYAGSPLKSGQSCYWKVQIWDEAGRTASSDPDNWEMGLLDAADWRGEWLAVEANDERDDRLAAPAWVGGTAPSPAKPRHFRLPFTSAAGPAVLILAADGAMSSLALDGKPLEQPTRDPNGFGGAPALRVAFDLAAGPHVLTVAIAPLAGFVVKPTVSIAALLRLPSDGGPRRLSRGWQTRMDPDPEWQPAPPAPAQPSFPWPPTPARLLRRTFEAEGSVARARLYVSAFGGYRLWLNGSRIGSDELQSEAANYAKRIPYRIHDVTALLSSGPNVLAALVGDGYFASYQAPEGRFAYGAAPRRIRMFLEIVGCDGTVRHVATDGEWRHLGSPLLMSEIYAGEDQDLRLWPDGWLTDGFDDAGWTRAWSAPEPQAPCSAALSEPIRIVRTIKPEAILRVAQDRFIIDFGQNFAGRVRVRCRGRAGQSVMVRHAEVLTADRQLDRRNLRAARAEDRYILAGAPRGEVLEPILTYQGFRYAEVEGLSELDSQSVEGLVLSTALDETGTFRVDQPRLQKVWLNTLWSQRSNFVGIPTDCPQRDERLGWTGDAQVFWDAASFNMNLGAFTRSFCRLLRDAQSDSGAWAPNPSGLGWGATGPTPGWADAGVMLPYTAYLHTGDRTLVDENWAAMTAYLSGILDKNRDGLWLHERGADLGDWLALDAKFPMDETTPKDLIATAMLARSVDQVARMAKWTGRDQEASRWGEQFMQIKRAFQTRFVKPDGSIGNGSQSSYILALSIGLIDEARQSKAGAHLAADIRRRGTILSTGFLGTPLSLDALAQTGEHSLVWDLLLRREYPSWGYMVDSGATTIWERWNSDKGDVAMNSFNHYALGAVCGFLYRRIAGIQPVQPGFARVRVAPIYDERIKYGGATVETVRGRVETRWEWTGSTIALRVSLPANTEGEIVLPSGPQQVLAGDHRYEFALS